MSGLQGSREVEVSTPLGDDVLLFQRMTATEHMGRLFEYQLDVVSRDANINLDNLLGQNVTVSLKMDGNESRFFNGFVSRFCFVGLAENFYSYQLTLKPWLWFLTRTADCRIFQKQKAPDIIKQVFRDQGFTDFEEKLSATYREWEYCVQYRETDFNFVSRLMEQEGMYYYFTHEDGKHTLVLSDSIEAHETVSDYEEVPYYPPEETMRRERDHIYDWFLAQEVQPGTYALNDFDFEKPKADLNVKLKQPYGHVEDEYEVFDYPGEYIKRDDGDEYVRKRVEELHAQYAQAQGQGNARGLMVGALFTLTQYPRDDQNKEYLITSATYELQSDEYGSASSESAEQIFTCSFSAIDSAQPFRSSRITPKPVVQGPQTAIIVGPSGQEIHTDKFGRVKVQFHWDREGKSDENSSCWIRVSHPTAGKGWGAVQIPRIGQEVIVDFLEGDPDRPLVTGRVYNADLMPPFELPGGGMVSGMKSNSTPGGGGYNEISMNDTKGKEGMTIHAQYDRNSTIEHDDSLTVNNNRTVTIKNNATIKITDGNLDHDVATGTASYHVTSDVSEKFDATQKTTVAGDITIVSTGGAIKIDAANKITLHTGASTIEMDSGGNIKIDGVNVSINGKATVAIAGGSVTSEAKAQHQTTGAVIKSEASGPNIVKGATVILN
ncbi:MAG: type VI secretion system tip protein TssI/VgrG [Gammaproteobacteria bacterium]|jgi:type VI secretion system secreted protein VgrG